jgi:preprotein translocase SecF subunit
VLNLVSKRFIFFAISLLFIIPGILALLVWHFNLGLDFKGGAVVDLQFSREVPTSAVQKAFAHYHVTDLTVGTAQDTSHDPKMTFWLRFNVGIDDNAKNQVVTSLNSLAAQLGQGGKLDNEAAGDFQRLVTFDGGKHYFSILTVRFLGLKNPPQIQQIQAAIAGIKNLKTTAQPAPTPTPTPTPTKTPTPNPSATPTHTPTHTPTPSPTPAPTPSPTPNPSVTPTPSPTPSPTPIPSPTATPTPNPLSNIAVFLCDTQGVKNGVTCKSGDGVQSGTTNTVITVTTSSALSDPQIKNIETGLMQSQNSYLVEQSKDTVSPSIASETLYRAIGAVALASVAILLYIWFAFRKLAKPWRYGTCAIIALLHDALVVLGMAAIIGHFDPSYQVDSLFVTAMLTVIGFSVHDTIVVFDRIRENLQRRTNETFEQVVNASLVQTMARSLNTSLTVLFTLSALTLFGGVSIRSFTLTLLIGIFSGTYSSIFNASMLLVSWERGELGRLFGFKPRPPQDRRPVRRRPVRA